MSINTKELNRIPMGSVDIYIMEFTGTKVSEIPEDSVIETEENLIGRIKDGGTVTYKPTYYTAKSDDGKAKRTDLTEEDVSISFGLITLAGDALVRLVPTAKSTTENGERITEIGGIDNDNGKVYLVRAVHKDKKKGDVRYTIIGRNVEGFAAAYKPNQECIITPSIDADPFENGRLLLIKESDIPSSASQVAE